MPASFTSFFTSLDHPLPLRQRGKLWISTLPTQSFLSLSFVCSLVFFSVFTSTAYAQMEQRPNNRDDYVYKSEMEEEPEVRMTHCQKLERQLANIYIRNNDNSNFDRAANLNKEIAQESKRYKKLQRQADRRNCYENAFLFGKTLRRTRKCISLDRKIRQAKSNLLRLDDDRRDVREPRNNNRQRDSLLDALARNRCGRRYEQVRRDNSFGSSIFGEGGIFGGGGNQPRRDRNIEPDQIKPYATYRTMCVRLCDGFYFPVSFSALPSKFEADSLACQDRCAAPTQLFVYRNPGAEIEQMIDSQDHMPYSKLPNAWKFKKSYVKGCSCKQAEYTPEGENPNQNAEAAPQNGAASGAGSKQAQVIKDASGFETTVQSEPLEDLTKPQKPKMPKP